jgi:hypothetical protein
VKIGYLNGIRLYYAFLAGGNAVINDQKYLNKINVFPVPDGDTGTNLASTFRSIAACVVPSPSIKATLRSIENAALSGARGNSGIIFAQFLHGISREIKAEMKVSTQSFGESVKKAVQHAYEALVFPVEGTMLTVMKDWAEAVYRHRTKTSDFTELLSHSLKAAKLSLKNTPKKLSILARAGVVDAGGKGFVDFLEGILEFIKQGKLKGVLLSKSQPEEFDSHVHTQRDSTKHRFCAEALLTGKNLELDKLRAALFPYGDSAIVAGSDTLARLHIHTDSPSDLFIRLNDFGAITQIKVDDMRKQYEVSHQRKFRIALVIDSCCDLSAEIVDRLQINVIPFVVSFGESLFLDKVTLQPSQFYSMLETSKQYPSTSVPGIKTVQNLFQFLASYYDSILTICLSNKFSGMYSLCQNAAASMKDKKISVIDSRHISASQGLIVMRTAEAIEQEKSHEEIQQSIQDWIANTKIFVDIHTLKYMVRSGRVSPIKGFVAKWLNMKPIITVDSEGRSEAIGRSFTRSQNMKKIIRILTRMSRKRAIWNYGIVHVQSFSRAAHYAEKLTEIFSMPPAFIEEVAPAVGVHTGIGTVGVAVMVE